jgi:hypothetical protein
MEPKGIRSALRKIEEQEGAAAALTTAKRWANALDEMHEVACPTMHTLRPGGPQKLCTAILLLAVNDYIAKSPLTIAGN